ncbi:hypothetical protein ACXX9E_29780 [Pseudomonas sp. GNP014]
MVRPEPRLLRTPPSIADHLVAVRRGWIRSQQRGHPHPRWKAPTALTARRFATLQR